MIKQSFVISRRYWKVYVYYDVTSSDIDEIISFIYEHGYPKHYITSAYTILSSNKKNQGITYSNSNKRESLVVITETTTSSEFINSLFHEITHLNAHIAKTYNIDYLSEEFAYIAGDIAQEMYSKCHKLLCDTCRSK